MMSTVSDPVSGPTGPVFTAPVNLSPSRVASFTSCPLAFRFSSIERLPEPPSLPATRGSMVHRALELFFLNPPPGRTRDALGAATDQMFDEYQTHDDLVGLDLDERALEQLRRDCTALADNYLEMEDPASVNEIGLEIRLEATIDGIGLRGIIDRLDRTAEGELVVTDYKTGRAPGPNYERASLAGVSFYALLCEQVLGQRPSSLRLMYLKSKQTITTEPTDQSLRFLMTRTKAVFDAIGRACSTGDFRARPSGLCRSCAFQRWCPEFGGDPDHASIELLGADGTVTATPAPSTEPITPSTP